jgi:hypothetical protein
MPHVNLKHIQQQNNKIMGDVYVCHLDGSPRKVIGRIFDMALKLY